MAATDAPTFLPLFVGVDQGIFKKYGIDLKVVATSGSVAVAGLASGSFQVSIFAGTIEADPSGHKLAFFGSMQNEFNSFAMYGKPGIKSLADLKGMPIASSTRGATGDIVLRRLLQKAGLNPETDVKWIYANTPPGQWAALQSGQVAATVLTWPSYLDAQKAGFIKLADSKDLHMPAASAALSLSREWVAKNPGLMERYLKALIEATALNDSDPAKAKAALGKRVKVDDQAALNDGYSRYAHTFPNPPYITREAVEENIEDSPSPEAKQHKPEDYIDNGPLDAVVKSGFAKQFVTNSKV